MTRVVGVLRNTLLVTPLTPTPTPLRRQTRHYQSYPPSRPLTLERPPVGCPPFMDPEAI